MRNTISNTISNLVVNSGTVGDTVYSDYNTRVVAAGGSLQGGDQAIIKSFVDTLNTAGVWNKLSDVGIFFGAFAGCFVKLKYGNSSIKSLINTAFVSGDYGESTGLASATTTKYMDTQFIPASNGLSQNNFSMGCYMLKDFSISQGYLMCDSKASGRNRVEIQKNFAGSYRDDSVATYVRNLIQNNVNDPHFISLGLGTYVNITENYQRSLLDNTVAVTVSPITLDSSIRLLRGKDSGSDITGSGTIAFYYVGQFLTYVETRILEKAVETLLIAKGRLTIPAQCIVFGDSITFGYGLGSYLQRFSYVLAGQFGLQERCHGIPSSVYRLDAASVAGGYPRRAELLDYNVANANSKIIIQYGVNDYSYGNGGAITSDFTAKLVTQVNELVAAGATLANIQIGSPSLTNNGVSTAIQQSFRDAAQAAAHTTGCKFADVWQYMTDNGGAATNLQADNLHPNTQGNINIAQCHFANATFV